MAAGAGWDGNVDGGESGAGQAAAQNLCALATRSLGVDGSSISVMTPSGHSGVIASTGGVAGRLHDLEFTLGEGPAMDAFATGRPVLVPDLAAVDGAPWQEFNRAAQQSGVHAVFAFPLRIGAASLGVLLAHRAAPGPLTERQSTDALRLAELGAYLIIEVLSARRSGAGIPADGDDSAAGLAESYLSAEVHQASGMVMIQLGVPIEDALVRLRALAFSLDRPLREVAHEIVVRNIRLER